MEKIWNLKLLYNSINDPLIQKDIDKGTKQIHDFISKWKNNKEYTKQPNVLASALEDYEKLHNDMIIDKPLYYFLLLSNLDQSDPDIKAKNNQLSELVTNLDNELQFFVLNISKIAKNKQKEFLTYPKLKRYKHYLEKIFNEAKYLLSDKEEKVFNLMSKTSSSNWVDMISELLDKQEIEVLDETLKKKNVPYNETFKFFDSLNPKVREYAVKSFEKTNKKYIEIAEFEMNSVLESEKVSEKYRHIPRPDLPRHLGDDIETEVVDTLVNTVSKHFDISKEYYKRKANLLNFKNFKYYDKNIPLVKENKKEYPLDEAFNIVETNFDALDKGFGDILRQFKNSGRYDIYPKTKKSGGAFCISINKTLPTYILLNHNNQLNDVLTIAHETGHGIHFEMSRNKQNSLYVHAATSLAEIASTFFEGYVLDSILEQTTDEEEKRSILDTKLRNDIATIFRQIAFYNFEKELHNDFNSKGFLTKEYISDLFTKHMMSYLGDMFIPDVNMGMGWLYVSHFRNPFYVYSYASGLLISKALLRMVKEDKTNIKYVKEFLESGSSKSPKELFMDMGIDITKEEFWNKGIQSIQEDLDKL